MVILSLVSLPLYILGISKPVICFWGKSDPLLLFLCIDPTLFAPSRFFYFYSLCSSEPSSLSCSCFAASLLFSLSRHSDLSTCSSGFVLPSKNLCSPQEFLGTHSYLSSFQQMLFSALNISALFPTST